MASRIKQSVRQKIKVRTTLAQTGVAIGTSLIIFFLITLHTFFGSTEHGKANIPQSVSVYAYFSEVSFSAKGFGDEIKICNYKVKLFLENSDFRHVSEGGHIYSTYGDDILFTKPNKTPLEFNLLDFDPATGRIEVDILLDTLYGNNTNTINVYYGNEEMADNIWRPYLRSGKKMDTILAASYLNSKINI